jgi:hypothetical protein
MPKIIVASDENLIANERFLFFHGNMPVKKFARLLVNPRLIFDQLDFPLPCLTIYPSFRIKYPSG